MPAESDGGLNFPTESTMRVMSHQDRRMTDVWTALIEAAGKGSYEPHTPEELMGQCEAAIT
jgi:hypothetical protein